MLRRRLSAGALRAAAQAQLHSPAARTTSVASAAKATISTPTQSKTLASGVLLGTQRSWKADTVVNLKAELKRRGLSQSGNKATLVARLESADTTSQLPPVPPSTSTHARAAAKARAIRARAFSATPAAQAKTKDTGPTENVVTTSADVAVNAPRNAAPSTEAVTEEQKTTAPGLPIKENIASQGLDIKFPEPQDIKPREQVIPFTPDNFRSSADAVKEPESKEDEGPTVVTVASSATGPGVSHGSGAVEDPLETERADDAQQESALAQARSGAQGVKQAAQDKVDDVKLNAEEMKQTAKDKLASAQSAVQDTVEDVKSAVDVRAAEAKSVADTLASTLQSAQASAQDMLSSLTSPAQPSAADEKKLETEWEQSLSPADRDKVEQAKAATQEIWQLSGLTDDGAEYKASSRPLSSEERTGAWTLAGLVGAVLAAGWITKERPSKAQKEEKTAGENKVDEVVKK